MHIIKEAALLVIIVGLYPISFCDLGQNIPVLYAYFLIYKQAGLDLMIPKFLPTKQVL